MKRMTILFLMLIMLCSTSEIRSEDKIEIKDNVPGRFQLFQGEFKFVNIKGEQHWVRELFKLDTATGTIYICDGWQMKGKKEGEIIQRLKCKPFEEELVFQ